MNLSVPMPRGRWWTITVGRSPWLLPAWIVLWMMMALGTVVAFTYYLLWLVLKLAGMVMFGWIFLIIRR